MYKLLRINLYHPLIFSLKVTFLKNIGKPVNWRLLKEHFSHGGILEVEDCMRIIKQAANILKEEPNVLTLNEPVTVVGDIHGQFYDLLRILEVGGDISNIK